jgi:hypothetical protein
MSRLIAVLFLLLLAAAPARAQSALCLGAIRQAEAEAGIPAGLLLAIGRVESGRREPGGSRAEPWPWTINAEGRGSFYPSREEAIAAVRAAQAGGARLIDTGCMQVNLRHHPDAFASLEEAFDPLANARYAARFLGALQQRAGSWEIAAGHYHSQTPERAEGYRARVLAAWAEERANPTAVPPAMLAARPAGPPAAFSFANGAANVAVVAAPPGSTGRGLDAYRAAAIPIAGRASQQLAQARPVAEPPRPAGRRLF